MLNKSIVNFAGADNKFYERFADYAAHRHAFEKKNNVAMFDQSMSLQEKANRINVEFFQELERVSNVSRPEGQFANAWSSNPQVQWASFAIIDNLLEIVIPLLNDDMLAPFVNTQTVGETDIVRLKTKPGGRMTISASANGERQTLRTRKFEKEIVLAPQSHMVTVYSKYFNVLNGLEPVCDYVFQIAQSFAELINNDCWETLTKHVANDAIKFTGNGTATDIIKICSYIERLNGGMKPIIMGTPTAIMQLPLVSVAGGGGQVTRQMNDNNNPGFITNFYGYDLYQMPYMLADTTVAGNPFGQEFTATAGLDAKFKGGYNVGAGPTLMPFDKTLYVMCSGLVKPVQLAMGEGFSNSNDFLQNADLTSQTTWRKYWGTACIDTGYMGAVKLA